MNNMLIARHKRTKKVVAISDATEEIEHILCLIEDSLLSSEECEIIEMPLTIGLIVNNGSASFSMDTISDLENCSTYEWEDLPILTSREAQKANYETDIF